MTDLQNAIDAINTQIDATGQIVRTLGEIQLGGSGAGWCQHELNREYEKLLSLYRQRSTLYAARQS